MVYEYGENKNLGDVTMPTFEDNWSVWNNNKTQPSVTGVYF